ncbi:MAG: hypothetical protein ABFR35_05210 [Thermodesulfobacteriota bacterium]
MIKNFQTEQKYHLHRSFYVTAVLFILLGLLQFSCTPEPADTTLSDDAGLFETYVQGPVTLDQRINKKGITIAEQLEVVLETSAPESFEIKFPAYSASLGDFTLIDVKNHPARMAGTGDNIRVIHAATYFLEPYLPGTYTIPKMTVTYLDRNNEAESYQIVTEEIQIAVKSLLDKDTGSVEIKDIKGPLSLPENTALQILLVGSGLLLVMLGIAGFLYWQKTAGNKKPPEIQLRPEEIALQELERLLAEDLLTRGGVKLFHLKISDILRHYIENRFGIRAAERTTEEFLTELSVAKSQRDSLLGSHKTLLADFLIHCDLVKFAKHEPTIAESEKTVSICREFIEKTIEKVSRFQGVEVSRGKDN